MMVIIELLRFFQMPSVREHTNFRRVHTARYFPAGKKTHTFGIQTETWLLLLLLLFSSTTQVENFMQTNLTG